jgi:hypothetical protein
MKYKAYFGFGVTVGDETYTHKNENFRRLSEKTGTGVG